MGDQIEIALNDKVILADRFEREHHTDRQPTFYLYRKSLGSPPAKFGDYDLRVQLTKSRARRI